MISCLYFQNYKSFGPPQEMHLRPLTVIIGRNNSGKSVCGRLPVLLSAGLKTHHGQPIDMTAGGIDFGGSFLDLVHGRKTHGSFNIGLEVKDPATGETVGFRSKFQHFDEYKSLQVTEFDLLRNGQSSIRWGWVGEDPRSDAHLFKNLDSEQIQHLSFRGIFPTEYQASSSRTPICEDFRQQIDSALAPLLYLGPLRGRPERGYRYSGARPDDVGQGGTDAPQLLAYSHLQGDDATTRAVSDWFKQNLGARIEIDSGDTFGIVVEHNGTKVNWVDVGVGISQVFPLALQRLAKGGIAPKLEIVEEPECHLHPAAHGALADLYIAGLAQTQFIIETHSEVFLLRLRRRIAEGTLAPDQVVIYWVDDQNDSATQLKRIEIDDQGDLSDWPQGVFSEDFQEVKAIRKAKP